MSNDPKTLFLRAVHDKRAADGWTSLLDVHVALSCPVGGPHAVRLRQVLGALCSMGFLREKTADGKFWMQLTDSGRLLLLGPGAPGTGEPGGSPPEAT